MIEIAKYDLEGNFLEEIKGENYRQVALQLGIDASSLMNNIEGTVLTCENFQYKCKNTKGVYFFKLPEVWNINNAGHLNKVIGKYYKNRLICTYTNLQEASERNKVDKAQLSRCLNNKNKSAGGYSWKYID